MAEPQPKVGFGPTPEVTGYFERKGVVPAFKWLDVWGEEHSYNFMVSGATDLELTTAFRDSIATALRTGQGFDNWRHGMREELARLGWLGPRTVSDPTGKEPDRVVDFSSGRRLKTIFWSNMNSARAAGQWERAQRTKKALPYFLYIRTSSKDPREEHLGWVGIILPVDHPFWITHFPPNGWLCKCQVRQITAREAERLLGLTAEPGGIQYTKEVPDLGPPVAHRNRRTGQITMVPRGIDPGWHTNPGLARSTTLLHHAEARLEAASSGDATAKLKEMWNDPFLKVAPKLPQKTWMPAGHAPHLVEELPGAIGPLVSVASDTVVERMKRHDMKVDDFARLPDMIARGRILPDERGNPKVRTIVGRFGKQLWCAFVSLSSGGRLRINSLHQRRERDMARTLERSGLKLEDLDDLAE